MSASVPADSAPEPSVPDAAPAPEASAQVMDEPSAQAAGPSVPSVDGSSVPTADATSAQAADEESYSPFRRRPDRPRLGWLGWVVIGVPTAVLAGGWAIIMAHVGQTPGISMETRTVDLHDNAAVVTYAVGKPEDEQVRCVVDAYDEKLSVLAQREITVPKGTAKVTARETLATPRKATGGRIRDCHRV
ncbi:DUF4307 domain-containing protein [Actinomadura rupiterrae]|uniref:DUF4307 domain-containing protein n=1 Tax=Actinomadura rupiterrae TaxID=559627 RepID=UPI0020A3B1A7|nr:DUF4307 domain-containing protein [Actinomadura rupiterrae]MCP2336755.1 hypothetical protein [Actinomadura rupiterrae]